MLDLSQFEVLTTQTIRMGVYDPAIFAIKKDSNRDIEPDRVNKTKTSLLKNGWVIDVPILMYWDKDIERYVPVDGQGRLTAAIELGANFPFVVIDNNPIIIGTPGSKIFENVLGTTTIKKMMQIINNSANSNWTTKDRSKNMARSGNPHFIFMEQIRTQTGYDNNTLNSIVGVAGITKIPYTNTTIDAGTFECDHSPEADLAVQEVLTELKEFLSAIPFQLFKKVTGRGLKALLLVMTQKKYQHDHFVTELKANPNSWVNGKDEFSCIDMVLEFHNRSLKKSQKIIRNETCKSSKSSKFFF